MSVEDDFEVRLNEGIAEYLAAAGIGLTWVPSGAYTAAQTGIVIDAVPPAPSRLVTLTTILLGLLQTAGDVRVNLQVRTRGLAFDGSTGEGGPSDVAKLDRAIRNVLVPARSLTLPNGIRISSIEDGPSARLGQDENTPPRFMRSHNYPLAVTDPAFAVL